MNSVITKSLFVTAIAVIVTYLLRNVFHTDQNLADVGGVSVFIGAFGTLYGILMAFVVFEVWGQYNKTTEAIDQEGQALERLYRLTLYFRDKKLTSEMGKAITTYANSVIEGNFKTLGTGQRNTQNGKLFRDISAVIREVKFDDEHDQVVFGKLLDQYGHLSEVRTIRINQSLQRIPALLKVFVYSASAFVILTFLLLPFANFYYSVLCVMAITFVISMVYQLIEDLDNPFVGNWNLTPEPFERVLKHIREDY